MGAAMKATFYKQRKNKLVCGVMAGLSDKFGWDITIARVLAALFMYFSGMGIILYIILAIFLPFKEDLEQENTTTNDYQRHYGPRQRKDAEVIDEEDAQTKDGWFW